MSTSQSAAVMLCDCGVKPGMSHYRCGWQVTLSCDRSLTHIIPECFGDEYRSGVCVVYLFHYAEISVKPKTLNGLSICICSHVSVLPMYVCVCLYLSVCLCLHTAECARSSVGRDGLWTSESTWERLLLVFIQRRGRCPGEFTFISSVQFSRLHLCLEVQSEDYQNCPLPCCVWKLCTVLCTLVWAVLTLMHLFTFLFCVFFSLG